LAGILVAMASSFSSAWRHRLARLTKMVPHDESSQIRATTEIELGYIHRRRPAVLRAETLKRNFNIFLKCRLKKSLKKNKANLNQSSQKGFTQ